MSEIGIRIKSAREDAQMTMETLSQKINVTKATIHKYETGLIKNIPSDKIELIAKATNVSEAFIMGWDEIPKLDSLLGKISANEKEIDTEFMENYIELSDEQKALLLQVMKQLKKE